MFGRQHALSRLEAFSDAVFAFALTLLVVSLNVPSTYDELMALMAGSVPFAAAALSGFTYFLMGPAHWACAVMAARRKRALAAALAADSAPA